MRALTVMATRPNIQARKNGERLKYTIIAYATLGLFCVTVARGLPSFSNLPSLMAVAALSIEGAVLVGRQFEIMAQETAITGRFEAISLGIGSIHTCLFYIFCQIFAIYP